MRTYRFTVLGRAIVLESVTQNEKRAKQIEIVYRL
jgi:hypothetical protein